MSAPEAYLKKKIRDYLYSIGAYCFSPVQTGMGSATVDLLICYKGKFIGCEVKVPGNKPTARQHNTLQSIISAGGDAFWCDSFESFLGQMDLL